MDYWYDIGKGLKSIWSIYEIGCNADNVGIVGQNLTLIYENHWGPEKVSCPLPDNPTWRELYLAADNLIQLSGDSHHIFIERFTDRGNGIYELSTGS